jgi:hypothetical protein
VGEDRVRHARDRGEVLAAVAGPLRREVAAVAERARLDRDRLGAPAVGLGVHDVQRLGRAGDHELAPRHVAVQLDDAGVLRPRDRGLHERPRAGEGAPTGDLALEDARGELHGAGEARVLLSRREVLVPRGVQRADHPADAHRPDPVEQRLRDLLARVVGVHALHEPLVDRRGLLLAAGELRAVPPPHQPEARVPDPIAPFARPALLMVVVVAGLRIVPAAHVDAGVGGGDLLGIARADDVEVALGEAEGRHGEHVVGMEVPRVGGYAHGG